MSETTTWMDIYKAAGATVTERGVHFSGGDLRPFDIVLRVSLREVITDYDGVRVELTAPDGTGLVLFPADVRLPSKEAPDA